MIDFWGAIFIIVVGSLMHFVYDWTNHNKMIGYFVAVNESTWEHIKLVIAPTFLWMIVEYHFYFDNSSYFFARFIGLFVMMVLIPIIFYSYTHFTKKNIVWVDISTFMLSVICGQYVFHYLLSLERNSLFYTHIGILGLILIFLRYITHTFKPDKNFLHQDPITKKYGLQGHKK